MTAPAATARFRAAATNWRRPGVRRTVARTAAFNVASAAAAAIGGVVVARALGPSLRGDYAAITAWFGVVLMVGGMGQPAALCYFVARDPDRKRGYVATSRAMMLATGVAALVAGMLLAPVLAHGRPGVAIGYRIVFAASILAFVGASYTFSLQARVIRAWNWIRTIQPVLACAAILALWLSGILTLRSVLLVLPATMLIQLLWAYRCCRRNGLAPGRADVSLVRPLVAYGAAQIVALTPATLNAQLDQLVLSQTVPSADLGRYAIAVSLSSLPIPFVSAIGYVVFPRLAASGSHEAGASRLQHHAVFGSAVIAASMLVPLAVVAHWLVPLVFGAGYADAVLLLWILTPGGVFLACGQVVGDLLRGRGRPIVVAWAQGLAVVFTIALLVALLPVIGVYAAAVASTLAYGVALAAMLRSLRRLPPDAGPPRPRPESLVADR